MYLSITSAAVNLLSLSLVVFASNVVELTPANFDAVVGQGKPALVELCVQLLLIPWSSLTWGFFKALHLGGKWSQLSCGLLFTQWTDVPVVTAKYVSNS